MLSRQDRQSGDSGHTGRRGHRARVGGLGIPRKTALNVTWHGIQQIDLSLELRTLLKTIACAASALLYIFFCLTDPF